MHPTTKTLRRAAIYLRNNPNAFANGEHIGGIVSDHARHSNADAHECVELIREAIGMSGVTGALRVWAAKRTPKEAAALLERVAADFVPA